MSGFKFWYSLTRLIGLPGVPFLHFMTVISGKRNSLVLIKIYLCKVIQLGQARIIFLPADLSSVKVSTLLLRYSKNNIQRVIDDQ